MNKELNNRFVEMLGTRIIVDILSEERATKLIPCDDLELNEHQGMPYLTLQEIAEQLEKKFGKEIIVDVWEETGLNGCIYRYGNNGQHWTKHGETRGFA